MEVTMAIKQLLKKLASDDTAATAIEYGLILALLALASIGALSNLADETTSMWGDIASKTKESSEKARNGS